MNETEQANLEQKHFNGYHGEHQKHTFQYWIVLGTRNLTDRNRAASPPRADTVRPTHHVNVSLKPASTETSGYTNWTWRQHFAHAANKAHPRAKGRPVWAGPERHYTYWTAQELLDVYVPRFLRQVAKANQGPVSYGVWIEHGGLLGRPHAHIHLGGVGKLSAEKLERIWTAMNGGRAVIRRFDPAKNKNGYSYKFASSEQVDAMGRNHELLSAGNWWKPDRTHNDPEQARLFARTQETHHAR